MTSQNNHQNNIENSRKILSVTQTAVQQENKREDINEFITKFNHMFETTYLQVSKACDRQRRDNHEHIKLALVTQTKSNNNQEEEEEYDWSENNDVVSI